MAPPPRQRARPVRAHGAGGPRGARHRHAQREHGASTRRARHDRRGRGRWARSSSRAGRWLPGRPARATTRAVGISVGIRGTGHAGEPPPPQRRSRPPGRQAKPKPTATAKPTATPRPRTYKVKPGDTLTGIAAKFGTTVKKLSALNNITNPSLIRVGQVLQLPEPARRQAPGGVGSPARRQAPGGRTHADAAGGVRGQTHAPRGGTSRPRARARQRWQLRQYEVASRPPTWLTVAPQRWHAWPPRRCTRR